MANERMGIHVEFFMDKIQDELASEKEGRPIFKEQERALIRWVGDNKRELVIPANEKTVRERGSNRWLSYIDRFPDQYAAFKRNVQYIGNGTPLDEAPFLNNAQKAEMKALQIYTVEALADLDSAGQRKIGMGAAPLIAKAKAYIDNAKGSANVTAIAAQNAELKEQIERLQAQMTEFMTRPSVSPPNTVPQALEEIDEDLSGSPFLNWGDVDLKSFIKDKTGQAPRGTPSHETLVRMANEANSSHSEAA